MEPRRQWLGWVVAVALLGIGIVAISFAGLKSIEPAAPEVVVSAFVPSWSHLSCGTLVNSRPPISSEFATISFADPADQAHLQEVVKAANASCQSARQTHAVAVVVGVVLVALGLWLLRRTARSTTAQQREATAAG